MSGDGPEPPGPAPTSIPLESRMAVVEQRVVDMWGEMTLTRQRLHAIESDRATIQLILADIARMHETLTELRTAMKGTAESIAEDVFTAMMERREELARAVSGGRRGWITVVLQFGGWIVAAAALYVGLRGH